MNRPGDWSCRSCQHLNFQRRDSCQRCGDPRRSLGLGERGDFYGMGFGMGGRGGGGGGGSPFLSNFSNTGSSTGPDVRPGDWYCAIGNCGAHNFANRSTCFKCGVFKASEDLLERSGFGSFCGGGGSSASGGRSSWKSGDWICTRLECNEHNFASRMECFRCNAPRDSFSRPSY